jgi:excisionase family DNA binding protein
VLKRGASTNRREQRHRSANVLKGNVDCCQIEESRVERPADPIDEMIMFLVRGIRENLEQVRVTAGSAAVLRRARVLPVDADGVLQAKRSPHEVLDDDLVVPGVSEVVLVQETAMLAHSAQHGHLLLVDLAFRVLVELHPIAVVADREAVQVRVRPPHRRLEHVVQLGQTNGCRYEKATPHRRLDVDKRDAQLEDALAGRSRHAGTIRRLSWPRAASDEGGDSWAPEGSYTYCRYYGGGVMARPSVLSNAVRVEPRKADRESAAQVARAVRISKRQSITLQLPDGSSVPLPRALVDVLRASADELADGHAVTVLPSEVALTPAEAAELLGLSRPFVVLLLDENEIPSERLPRSRHRRVLLSDVLHFQAQREKRRTGRQRVAQAIEEADLPY